MKKYILLLITGLILLACQRKANLNDLENGDIIFQTSKSEQSKAIQAATDSRYSHMGIIYKQKGRLYVYEAVQPVKLTPLRKWIKRGVDEHFVVKRLKNAEKLLSPANLKKMKKVGEQYRGKNYDFYFQWSDSRIYCSELVWKIYKNSLDIKVGQLEKLGNFDLSHPAVKAKLKKRFGKKIPLDEQVISPAAMYQCEKLETILRN